MINPNETKSVFWLIVVVALVVGGYFVYKHFFSCKADYDKNTNNLATNAAAEVVEDLNNKNN